MDVPAARRAIRTRAALLRFGMAERELSRRVESGSLRRLGRGLYADAASIDALRPEDRHLVHIAAVDRRESGAAHVFSHLSAAVLQGLPVYGTRTHPVHVSSTAVDGRVSAHPRIARHRRDLDPVHVTSVGGVRCTDLALTVADVLATESPEIAVSIIDAALRGVAWVDSSHTYDDVAHDGFCREVAAHLPPGRRGVRRARRILEMADGRAQLPAESVSRLRLLDAGFARPRLQVPVGGPRGETFYVDMSLDDVDAWAEVDGRAKYADPALRGPDVSMEQVLWREKEREDWIRGVTGRRVIRWGSADIATPDRFLARLAAFGVRPPH